MTGENPTPQADAAPKPPKPLDLRGLHPEVQDQIEQQKEDSMGALREFLDKMERSTAAETLKKVIRAEIRSSIVRQGQPATETYDKRPNQGSETLLTLSESWMDAYLMSHAQMKARFIRGEIDAVDLFKMILHIALDKALSTATGQEAQDLREAQDQLTQALSYPENATLGTIDMPARIGKIRKDSGELCRIAERIIEENKHGKGPFVQEINGYKFSIINEIGTASMDVTKDSKTIHMEMSFDGDIWMSMDGASIGSYQTKTANLPEKVDRPEIIGPKLDQFVSLLHQLQYAKDAEVREF